MPEMFEKACQSNKSNKVHELLTANRFVPIEIKNSKGETGTVIACSHGAVDVLDIFIGYYYYFFVLLFFNFYRFISVILLHYFC